MLTKTEIFKDIQAIMEYDYAGYLDKKQVNYPGVYIVTNDMSDVDFEATIQDYLLDFNDGHLSFLSTSTMLPNVGFSVRRFEDALYVTDSPQEKQLQKGDKLIAIDGLSIKELAISYRKRLEDPVPERQKWNKVIRSAKTVTVNRDDEQLQITLGDYDREPFTPNYLFNQLSENIGYMKLTDFTQAKPIQDLIEKNYSSINNSNNLIIDVRVNYGGNDAFYFPILPFVFDCEMKIEELFQPDEVMFTNYTERNCELWIKELQEYLQQELDKETENVLQNEIVKFEQNRGSGLLEDSPELDVTIQGQKNPQHIYVLTDVMCGSSGDTFVSNVKKSSKVTVVGRPILGIIDFFNVVTVDYGAFEFVYSISKMHENYYTNDTGVLPHIYIPWTPQHITEDVDLNVVLGLIGKGEN